MIETSRDALVEYIEELRTLDYPWYERAGALDFYGWVVLQALATIAGFATSLLVALQQGMTKFGRVQITRVPQPTRV